MIHPLEHIATEKRRVWFVFFALVSVLLTLALGAIGDPLRTPEAPYGILSYELIWTGAEATRIIAGWDEHTRLLAAFTIGLDYLYLAVYATSIGLGCLLVGRRLALRERNIPASISRAFAWAALVAALLDAVENSALTWLLVADPGSRTLALLASLCASVKFALVGLSLAFVAIGFVASFGGRSFE